MVKLNWTPQSKGDLVAIAEYIGQDSKKYARIQIQRIRARARQLIEYPESGRIVPEIGDPAIKELVIGTYRIIYHLHSNQRVDIITVHHSARLLKL